MAIGIVASSARSSSSSPAPRDAIPQQTSSRYITPSSSSSSAAAVATSSADQLSKLIDVKPTVIEEKKYFVHTPYSLPPPDPSVDEDVYEEEEEFDNDEYDEAESAQVVEGQSSLATVPAPLKIRKRGSRGGRRVQAHRAAAAARREQQRMLYGYVPSFPSHRNGYNNRNSNRQHYSNQQQEKRTAQVNGHPQTAPYSHSTEYSVSCSPAQSMYHNQPCEDDYTSYGTQFISHAPQAGSSGSEYSTRNLYDQVNYVPNSYGKNVSTHHPYMHPCSSQNFCVEDDY